MFYSIIRYLTRKRIIPLAAGNEQSFPIHTCPASLPSLETTKIHNAFFKIKLMFKTSSSFCLVVTALFHHFSLLIVRSLIIANFWIDE